MLSTPRHRPTRPSRLTAVAAVAVGSLTIAACHLPPPTETAALSASPNPLVLATNIGAPPDVDSVTITNTGDAATKGPLYVQALGSFTPTGDTCSGQVLDPAETCELEFTYPAADGLEARDSSVLVGVQGDVVFVNIRVSGQTFAPGA